MEKLLFFISAILLISCSGNKDTKPDNLVDDKVFIRILADIHTEEAKAFLTRPNGIDTAYAVYKNGENAILKSYKTKRADYDSTYAYYSRHPKEFDQLYAAVIDTLAIRETKQILK